MSTDKRHVGLIILSFLVALAVGVGYLFAVQYTLHFLWAQVPDAMDSTVLLGVYAVVLLTGGAVCVSLIRKHTGRFGHSPLDGLAVRVSPIAASLTSLATVLISLVCGAVLGPEAGLLAIGTAVGVWFSTQARGDAETADRFVKIAVLGAVVALPVNMAGGATIKIVDETFAVVWTDIVWTVPVAIVAAVALAAVRFPAYLLRSWADTQPARPVRAAVIGVLVATVAVAAVAATQVDPQLIFGSGEGFLGGVFAITSLGTLLIVLVAKALAYSLCLGGGFRGGPIFPAMYIGVGIAAVFHLLDAPGQAPVLAAAGLLAATTTGLKLNWLGLAITAVVVGLLLGSLLLIAPCLIGAAIGKLMALVLDRIPGVGVQPR